MANTLATLVVRMQADVGAFTQDLGRAAHVSEREWRKIRRQAEDAAKAIVAGAAIAGAAMVKFGKDAIDTADEMAKLAQGAGMTVKSFSQLAYAAETTHLDAENLSDMLGDLSERMADMAAGTGSGKEAFQALGIQVTTADGHLKSVEQVLGEIADKFAGMEDGAGKTAIAMKFFSDTGKRLIPLLNQGSEGIKRLRSESDELGVTIGDKAAHAAVEFNLELTKLNSTFDGVARSLTLGVLPQLTEFIKQVGEATKVSGNLIAGLNTMANVRHFGDTPGEQLKNINKALEETKELQKLFRGASITQGILGIRESNLLAARELVKLKMPDMVGDTGIPQPPLLPKPPAPALPSSTGTANAKAVQDHINRQLIEGQQDFRDKQAEIDAFYYNKQKEEGEHAVKAAKQSQQAMLDQIDEVQADAIAQGAIMSAAITEQAKARQQALQDNADAARELGFTFESAFEDAIVEGKKLSDVLKGLEKDIARVIIRKTITEPLGDAVGSFAKSLFGGFKADGGPVSPGKAYMVGEDGPEMFMPTTAGNILPNGWNRQAAFERVTSLDMTANVNVTFNLGLIGDPRAAASVIMAHENLIVGMIRRAWNRRGFVTPMG